MRDMKSCHHTVSEDVIYKEVVVIGNGPSGMVTSYMLAGNVPYLKDHIPEDLPIDEMLRARLQGVLGQSLYEADLSHLAEGLEGRSHSPLPLLMDNLLRPCADMGLEADPLIEWRFDVEKQVDHVVLGREPPGGAWHTFPPSVRTLSPAAWLALPPHRSACADRLGAPGAERLGARAVAAYCRRYVRQCRLQRYFRSGVVVTSVSLAPPPPAAPCRTPACPLNAKWLVSGYDTASLRPFRYRCARAVLAAGGAARANTLGARAPAAAAAHGLALAERAIDALRAHATPGAPPPLVLVVGSGVSAADALRLTRAAGLRAAHAHRDPAPALSALPPKLYPDYYQVYKMMCDGRAGKHHNYTAFPEHTILKITPDAGKDCPLVTTDDPELNDLLRPKKVKLRNVVTNDNVELHVSLITVLIGSKPDLFFLQTNLDFIDFNHNERVLCSKCAETKHAAKRKMEDDAQSKCFLKNHWSYLKSVLGQSIQSCKSRYLNAEINGNTETKCIVPDCNRRRDEKENCTCNKLDIKDKDKCECEHIPTHNAVKNKPQCQCEEENPYSDGIGFGLDPKKPVDCRSNPIAVDKSTHELLNAPSGMYALGPLTADNFIRYIPGGALAIVSHMHKQKKESSE